MLVVGMMVQTPESTFVARACECVVAVRGDGCTDEFGMTVRYVNGIGNKLGEL